MRRPCVPLPILSSTRPDSYTCIYSYTYNRFFKASPFATIASFPAEALWPSRPLLLISWRAQHHDRRLAWQVRAEGPIHVDDR